MNKLSAILRTIDGDRAVLKATVLYGDNGPQKTLDSYRADGVDTVLDYNERIRFTDAEFANALAGNGWGMEDRPVKTGMSYRYILKRGAEIRYTASAASCEQVERAVQRNVMRQIAVAEEMEREFAGL
jgi:hypothetical protein